MKIIVAGSRDLLIPQVEIHFALGVLTPLIAITEIVSGMARGPDLAGKRWAEENDCLCVEFPVSKEDWKRQPKLAGILRNEKMGDYADALVAFWDGKSSGTRHMFSYMQKLGKPFILICRR